jgi:hypothetical protein
MWQFWFYDNDHFGTHSPTPTEVVSFSLLISDGSHVLVSWGYPLTHGTKIWLVCADPALISFWVFGRIQELSLAVVDWIVLIWLSKPSASLEMLSGPVLKATTKSNLYNSTRALKLCTWVRATSQNSLGSSNSSRQEVAEHLPFALTKLSPWTPIILGRFSDRG